MINHDTYPRSEKHKYQQVATEFSFPYLFLVGQESLQLAQNYTSRLPMNLAAIVKRFEEAINHEKTDLLSCEPGVGTEFIFRGTRKGRGWGQGGASSIDHGQETSSYAAPRTVVTLGWDKFGNQ